MKIKGIGLFHVLLVAVLIFGFISPITSNAASIRTIEIKEITGKVFVQMAGGLKTIRAVTGMQLKQGDRLQTDEHSSAVLVTPDTKDIVTIGDKTDVSIAQLQSHKNNFFTILKVWYGTVYADVTPLENSKNTFQIDANGSHFQAKGTHFLVGVNPLTGNTQMLVLSGLVQTTRGEQTSQGNNPNPPNPVLVYPSQQINLNSNQPTEDLRTGIDYTDVGQVAQNASPKVIEALLKNAADIQNENDKLLQQLQEAVNRGQQNSVPNSIIRIQTPEDLEAVQSNMDNLLAGIAKEAVAKGKLNPELIDEVNKSLVDRKKLDLRDVRPINKSAGLDPEVERLKEEQKKIQQREMEEQRKLKENQDRLASLIEKIEQDRKRIEEANKKAQEEAAKKAAEKLKASLSEEQRKAFEQRENAREQERSNQENVGPMPTQPPANNGGGSTIIPPIFSNMKAVNIHLDSFEVSLTPNQAGMIYYVVLPSGAPVPNPSQIKEGLDSYGEAALSSGMQEFVRGTEVTIHVRDLEENTSYTVYVLAENNSQDLSEVFHLEVETSRAELQTTVTTDSITVGWENNAEYDDIRIIFENEEFILEGSQSTYTFEGLLPGTSYTILLEFRKQGEEEPSVTREVTVTTLNYFAELISIDNGATIGLSDMGVGRHYAEGVQPNQTYRIVGRLVNEYGQTIPEKRNITAEVTNAKGSISEITVNEDGTFEFTYQSAEQGSVNNHYQDVFDILINGFPTSSFWTNSYKEETSDLEHQLLGY